MTTTWDTTSNTAPGTPTFSVDDLTITGDTANIVNCWGTTGKSSGKWSYEVTADFSVTDPNNTSNSSVVVGIANKALTDFVVVSGVGTSPLWEVSSTINGTVRSVISSSPTIVRFDLDLANKKVEIQTPDIHLTGSNDTTGDINLHGTSGPYFPFVQISRTNQSATAAFSSLSTTPPTGFSTWDIPVSFLTPTFFNNKNIFSTDIITFGMSPSIFVDVDTFGTVRVFSKIAPEIFTEVNSFISPTVTSGILTIHPSIYFDIDTFGLNSVSERLFESIFTNSTSFNTPRVLTSTKFLNSHLFQDVNTFFQFLISLGIDPTEFINQSTFFPATSTFHPPLATPFKFRQLQNRYKLPILRTYRR